MQAQGADFTNTFRALGNGTARDQFTDRDAFDPWAQRHSARIAKFPDAQTLMNTTNPTVIPRNHRIEQMIQAAVAGDMAPFQRLMTAYATPYTLTDTELANPPTREEIVPATFCGT
jgi:uncharacterized protein YdiU (UPF0061 family)